MPYPLPQWPFVPNRDDVGVAVNVVVVQYSKAQRSNLASAIEPVSQSVSSGQLVAVAVGGQWSYHHPVVASLRLASSSPPTYLLLRLLLLLQPPTPIAIWPCSLSQRFARYSPLSVCRHPPAPRSDVPLLACVPCLCVISLGIFLVARSILDACLAPTAYSLGPVAISS
ncbi:unnamed protein product [Periconia digitata]|uniref:Uncharacterized protein n=1 Tax=Periconia digitata TaxID=1303443 RepID=A0A9W4UE32_9PLEO|nr:unnamed protein product [Periconia digitata]